jgi:alpha-L-fucosidase
MKILKTLLFLLLFPSVGFAGKHNIPDMPAYLAEYAELYKEDPRAANLKWFQNAEYGLFLHYGLYAPNG